MQYICCIEMVGLYVLNLLSYLCNYNYSIDFIIEWLFDIKKWNGLMVDIQYFVDEILKSNRV